MEDDVARAINEAVARAEGNADPLWLEMALWGIRVVCGRMDRFTADDIWELVPRPHTPAALGPVLLRARRIGMCDPTGEWQWTRDPTRHRQIQIWKSNLK